MTLTPIFLLRFFAWLEGISYILLLGVGMPLKYLYEMPKPNFYIGMAHGILFFVYCGLVLVVKSDKNWNFSKTFWALFASLIPFGTFVADAKLFRR